MHSRARSRFAWSRSEPPRSHMLACDRRLVARQEILGMDERGMNIEIADSRG